jgi:large repetitive protein
VHRALALALALAGCFYVTEQERADRFDLDGDGVERPADCDDTDPGVTDSVAFYEDADQDTFGDPATVERGCVAPEGFVADGTDCDDADDTSFPGATERCDGADNDCDRQVDEELSQVTWYRDDDGDEFGVDDDAVEDCARPPGYAPASGDCDDGDDAVHPDALEVCNGVDDDCVGGADEDDPAFVPPTWHADLDLDGYGAGPGTSGCEGPPGTVDDATDCDDGEAAVNPGASELCNGVDDDCDTTTDLGADDASQYYADDDEDGYGDALDPVDACPPPPPELAPPGLSTNPFDCDDQQPLAHPGAIECIDGFDNDCDSQTDESGC